MKHLSFKLRLLSHCPILWVVEIPVPGLEFSFSAEELLRGKHPEHLSWWEMRVFCVSKASQLFRRALARPNFVTHCFSRLTPNTPLSKQSGAMWLCKALVLNLNSFNYRAFRSIINLSGRRDYDFQNLFSQIVMFWGKKKKAI